MSLSIDGLAYWEDRAAVAVAASVEVSATGDNNSDLDGCKVISNACCLMQG